MYGILYSVDNLATMYFCLRVFVFLGNGRKESILSRLKIQNVKMIYVGEWDGGCSLSKGVERVRRGAVMD